MPISLYSKAFLTRVCLRWTPAIAASIIAGCSSPTEFSCIEGELRCSCYSNGSCTTGLECRANLCVLPGSGSGGSGGGANGDAGSSSSGNGGANPGSGGNGGATTGGTPNGGANTGGGNTCNSATFDPCSTIPYFEGTQTVDGDDNDFCDLPHFSFALSDGQFLQDNYSEVEPGSAPSGQPSATVRLGWSDTGLHLHARVTDSNVHPNVGTNAWDGTSLELFFAPKEATGLSVETGPPTPDAPYHAIVSAPEGNNAFAGMPEGELDGSWYQVVSTSDGYVVELQIPWAAETSISGGDTLAFNFALNSGRLNTEGTDPYTTRDWHGALVYACASTGYECGPPYSNPGTWCSPTAESP